MSLFTGITRINKILLRSVLAFTAIIFITGCASGPSFQEHSEQLSPLSENQTRLYIYRPESGASSVNPDIRIGGRTVGQVPAKGFLMLNTRAGGNIMTTTANPQIITSIFVKEGADTYIRLDVKQGFTVNAVDIRMMDPEVARAEIAKTTYSGK